MRIKGNAIFFTISTLTLLFGLLIGLPREDEIYMEMNRRLNGEINIVTSKKLLKYDLAIYVRSMLDYEIYMICDNGLNPNTQAYNLKISSWIAQSRRDLRMRGIDARIHVDVLSVGELQGDIGVSNVLRSIGCTQPRQGAVKVTLNLNYILTDAVSGIKCNESSNIRIVHPVRVFMLYDLSKEIFKASNETVNSNIISLNPRILVSRLENEFIKKLNDRVKSKVRLLRDLEVTVEYEIWVKICRKTILKNENKTVVIYYIYSGIRYKAYLKDIKKDAVILINHKITRPVYKVKKSVSGKVRKVKKVYSYEYDAYGCVTYSLKGKYKVES